MNENERMAELLLPDITKTPDYYEELYKPRNLPEGARVTRVAPSPTGYLHLGTLFTALVNRITATSSGGIFYTRIEDTDKKREVEGGVDDIIGGLDRFGIKIDEGFISGDKQIGDYERAEIYQTYAKSLIKQGLAYPCFCTPEELEETRRVQEEQKVRTGYHGEWAKHRNITADEAAALIEKGKPYVVRLRSPGNEENKIVFDDCIKGKIEMPENDEDFVILKSDGIPTYHFAHAVDDHLMRTTHVLRGDEWISSVPKHIQLFKLLGFKVPKYGHISPIMKLENGAKRKISKRKDPELALSYYKSEGYPTESVVEYIMTILNSNFEDWRRANPDAPLGDFKFTTKKMNAAGSLFDLAKLCDVSKNIISRWSAEKVYEETAEWAKEFDSEFYGEFTANPDFTKAVLAIGRGGSKPRKDFAVWSEVKGYMGFMFDKYYNAEGEYPQGFESSLIADVLKTYLAAYSSEDDQSAWFDKMKDVAEKFGFAREMKEYKANPDAYKGSIGDISSFVRVAITGKQNAPDLYTVMNILGENKSRERIEKQIERLGG